MINGDELQKKRKGGKNYHDYVNKLYDEACPKDSKLVLPCAQKYLWYLVILVYYAVYRIFPMFTDERSTKP